MPIERIPSREEQIQAVKQQISVADLIGSFTELRRSGNHFKAICPLHDDKDPSLAVYQNNWHCYGCKKGGDSIDWVRHKLGLSFADALQWLTERVGKIEPAPARLVRTAIKPIPVIPEIVEMWHGMLKPKHRAYYHSRLFTDATIDREMWGWSGHAYTLPVWEGRPQESECLGIRLRSTGENGPRYYGIRGSNSPQLYNSWSLCGEFGAFVFFGEFDAALACQDGFPSVSPTNGCASWDGSWDTVFADKSGIVIVPDFGEERHAHALAERLGQSRCRVLNLFTADAKDYNDWRLAGHRPVELLERLQEQYSQQVVEFDF